MESQQGSLRTKLKKQCSFRGEFFPDFFPHQVHLPKPFAWFLHHLSRGPAKRSLHPETRPEIRAKEFPAQNTVSRWLHFLKLRTPRRHCPGQDQDGNRGRLDRAGPSRLLGLVRSSCSKYLTPVW